MYLFINLVLGVQDLVNYAIQTLLKFLGCKSGDEEATQDVLQLFDDSTQLLIRPCAHSDYSLNAKKIEDYAGTIYMPGMTFAAWISTWMKGELIDCLGRVYI